jgi:hypothetical protein
MMDAASPKHETQVQLEAAMGPALGSVFYALYNEVVWLHAIWQEYRVLYGTSEEQLQVVNRAAGFFFKIVQDELWDGVLLRIAKLTDPPKSAGVANLTVRALPTLVTDLALSQQVAGLVDACILKAEFAREHRNKRIAHSDLLRSTNPAVPLSGISRRHVEEMLEALRNVMNALDVRYRETTVMYQDFVSTGGAQRLLYILRQAEGGQVAR